MNKLKPEIISKIQELYKAGNSIRQISRDTGCHTVTVGTYVNQLKYSLNEEAKSTEERGIKHHYKCDNCGDEFLDKNNERTGEYKRKKIKHFFCDVYCANRFKARIRENDRCKRCEKTRKELSRFPTLGVTGVIFSRGYCPKCYGILQQFHFDEELASAHEFNQQLKKENKNASKQYSGSSENAS